MHHEPDCRAGHSCDLDAACNIFIVRNWALKINVAAVTQSTFAALSGMFASMAVLVYFLWKTNLLTSILHKPANDCWNQHPCFAGGSRFGEAIPFIITRFCFIPAFPNQWPEWHLSIRWNGSPIITILSWWGHVRVISRTSQIRLHDFTIAVCLRSAVWDGTLTETMSGRFKGGCACSDNLGILLLFLYQQRWFRLSSPSLCIRFHGQPDSFSFGALHFSMLQALILGVYTVLSPMIQALFKIVKQLSILVTGSC